MSIRATVWVCELVGYLLNAAAGGGGERDVLSREKMNSWKTISRELPCQYKKTKRQSAGITVTVGHDEDQARGQKQCCWRYRLGGSESERYKKRVTVCREQEERGVGERSKVKGRVQVRKREQKIKTKKQIERKKGGKPRLAQRSQLDDIENRTQSLGRERACH